MSATPIEAVRVAVFLGTDHHPFQRLVDWVDEWAGDHPDVRCFIQHGPAAPPRHADGEAFVDVGRLREELRRATIAVGHAGPGTIVDARIAGRLPIVVPRLARLGEVVDDHQVAFGRWMADRGLALVAEDRAGVHRLLEAARADPDSVRLDAADPDRSPAVRLVGDLLDELMR
ncbi:MAG: glycosyl transferase family 28 [Actinobacteria bacterium]|nr:glycosyl transferase family 28 [Actinomycetota bacterium]